MSLKVFGEYSPGVFLKVIWLDLLKETYEQRVYGKKDKCTLCLMVKDDCSKCICHDYVKTVWLMNRKNIRRIEIHLCSYIRHLLTPDSAPITFEYSWQNIEHVRFCIIKIAEWVWYHDFDNVSG